MFRHKHTDNSFYMTLITSKEIASIMKNLKNSKSQGLDRITPLIVKGIRKHCERTHLPL